MLHSLPITPRPGAQGLSCPILLQRHLHFSSEWKKLPQGQVSNHKHWKPSQVRRLSGIPAEHRLNALCLPSTGVFLGGLGLPDGSNGSGCSWAQGCPCALWDAVLRKQKGLAAPGTHDCAREE